MPLVKSLDVNVELPSDTYRKREFYMTKDYIRRVELGKDVSIRSSTLKGAVVIETLRKISEPEVRIGDEALEAYGDAEGWLCTKMRNLFQNVRHLGMQPRHWLKNVAIYLDGHAESFIYPANKLVFVPMSAFYVGDERVYLFRAMPAENANKFEWTVHNTGVIGYTREYLNTLAPEVAAYIAKLENKAMQDEQVQESFTRLGAILRPEEYKREMLEARAKEYAKVESFGEWS